MNEKNYHSPNDDSVIWALSSVPERTAKTSVSLLRQGRGIGWAAYVVVDKK